MWRDHKATTQTGFSLLEVLITLVVLGAGLISLAKFQGTVLQDNDLAKARSVAAQLAEQKIEDLRSFTALVEPVPVTDPPGFAYNAIADNRSGRLLSGTVSTAELADSNVTYTRNWTVVNFCFPIARNSAAQQVVPGTICRRPIPDFKNITVTVTWVDKDGEASAGIGVALATSIAAVDPAYSGRVTQINAQRAAPAP